MTFYDDALEACQAAILKILAGSLQSYSIAGRSFNYLNLAELQAYEKTLQVQVARQNSGGLPVKGITPIV